MSKHLTSGKAVKTYGWAIISGLLFFFSGIAAGGWSQWWPMLVATLTCVALKTPVYWLYEHSWDFIWRTRRLSRGVRQPPLVSRLSPTTHSE
jgi:hypothetical protein